MKFKSTIKAIEKNIEKAFPDITEHRVLINVWNADGTLYHSNEVQNPTMTINIQGV